MRTERPGRAFKKRRLWADRRPVHQGKMKRSTLLLLLSLAAVASAAADAADGDGPQHRRLKRSAITFPSNTTFRSASGSALWATAAGSMLTFGLSVTNR